MLVEYRITLQGNQPGNRTTLAYSLGDFPAPVDFAAVSNAANQIRGALVDITGANVSKETLSFVVSSDNQLPAAGVDVTDEAVVIVHLNEPNTLEKLHPLRIPAPIPALFLPGGETVDIANADLIQFVQQISQHAEVSDGESVNVASGSNGIKRGYWRSRPKKLTGQ